MSTSTSSTTFDQAVGALGALTIRYDYQGRTTVVGTGKNSPADATLKAHPVRGQSRGG